MKHPCPECGTPMPIPDDVVVEETLECPECAVELQVVGLNPLALIIFEEAEK